MGKCFICGEEMIYQDKTQFINISLEEIQRTNHGDGSITGGCQSVGNIKCCLKCFTEAAGEEWVPADKRKLPDFSLSPYEEYCVKCGNDLKAMDAIVQRTGCTNDTANKAIQKHLHSTGKTK